MRLILEILWYFVLKTNFQWRKNMSVVLFWPQCVNGLNYYMIFQEWIMIAAGLVGACVSLCRLCPKENNAMGSVNNNNNSGGRNQKCILDHQCWVQQVFRTMLNYRYHSFALEDHVESCIKSQNLNVSRLVLQLSLCNILKPGVKSWMKM